MVGQNVWRVARSDYLKLLPILGLAFYIAFIPNQNYLYPVHIDEWVHLAYAKAMLQAQDVTFLDPFSGQPPVGLESKLYIGYYLFWGVFQDISGISWLTIFRYFPSIIFIFTALSTYVLARRWGAGWEAALFTSLIPTTIGILGPAFMVPLAMGLLFIPLCLFLAFSFRTGWSYLVLFIFMAFLISIHAATAIGLFILLVPYILLNLSGGFKHSLGIALAIVIPFLVLFPWIYNMLLPTFRLALSSQDIPFYIDFPRIIWKLGYLPIACSLLGILLLAYRGGRKNYGLIFGLLALLAMLMTFFTFHYGVSIMYQRGLMYVMLMLGIIAGVGLAGIKAIRLPGKLASGTKTILTGNVGNILCLGIIVAILVIGIPPHQRTTSYYYMIDKEDYQAFAWINDNVDENYRKAILDPWKATAFTAITQKSIYTRMHAYPMPKDKEAKAFLSNGSTDTSFLRENDITIIYSTEGSDNPDLTEVRKNVYLLKEAGS